MPRHHQRSGRAATARVGHATYPHAGPGPQIQYRLGIVQLRHTRGAIEGEQEYMMGQVEALLFKSVVWKQVLAGTVGMVCTAILVDILKD